MKFKYNLDEESVLIYRNKDESPIVLSENDVKNFFLCITKGRTKEQVRNNKNVAALIEHFTTTKSCKACGGSGLQGV